MKQGSKIRLMVWVIVLLFLGFYGYYNYLSYTIYKQMKLYQISESSTGAELAKKTILDKYPFSIYYFLVK